MKMPRPRHVNPPARKATPLDKPAPVKPSIPAHEPAKLATGVQNLAVSEDETGMRLDRWFKRRFPTLALSHLAKICRKGEVRLDGKRVETASRIAAGQNVRVPPLSVDAPKAPAVKSRRNRWRTSAPSRT